MRQAFVLATIAIALCGCDTLNWREAGRSWVDSACRDQGTCNKHCLGGKRETSDLDACVDDPDARR